MEVVFVARASSSLLHISRETLPMARLYPRIRSLALLFSNSQIRVIHHVLYCLVLLQFKMANTPATTTVPRLNKLDASKPHTFITPAKKINEGQDVSAFLTCKAYRDIMTFVLQLNASMFPRYITDNGPVPSSTQTWELGSPEVVFSNPVIQLRQLLSALNGIIDKVPPDKGPRRFGNVSFRKWFQTVEDRISELLSDHLPSEVLSFSTATEVSAKNELEAYLLGSFGSPQRLDYGTGHELSFLAFIGSIWKLGGFDTTAPGNEERAIVVGVIEPYVKRAVPSRRLVGG